MIRSVRTFLQNEYQRLYALLSGPADSLDSVETARTVGDCLDCRRLSRLPDGWRVTRDIVQFSGESLAEVVRLTDSEGYRITLKPVELCAPTERVDIYTRVSPAASRTHRQTADSLSEALEVATAIAARRTETASVSTAPPSRSHR